MKILFLSPGGSLGGAERCLLDLFSELPKEIPGIGLHLIQLTPGPLTEEAEKLGVPVTLLPLPEGWAALGDSALSQKGSVSSLLLRAPGLGLGIARYVHQLNAVLAREAPDIIHSNGIKAHLLLALARPKAAIIWHVHDFMGNRRFSGKVLTWASRRIYTVVANSKAVAAELGAIAKQAPALVVHNGIDTTEFSPAPADSTLLDTLSALPPSAPSTVRIGMVATYAKWKGHLKFLEAAKLVLDESKDRTLRFYVIGGPIYATKASQFSEEELREKARELGIADRVGFIGFQSHPAKIYQALDIVVHASTSPEPFGRTVIEAMGCGRPVVVSADGGVQELYTNEVDALAYPSGDVLSLSRALNLLIARPEIREKLGKNARDTVVKRFSNQRYTKQIADCYRKIVDGRAEQRPTRTFEPSFEWVVAMGYREDGWQSIRNVTEGLKDAMEHFGSPLYRHPSFFAPSCGHSPRWIDRRVLYSRRLPRGSLLQLMDHSYADALLGARKKFDHLSVVVHDLAFWRDRNLANGFFRKRILEGLTVADLRIAVSRATADEMERTIGLKAHAVIPWGLPLESFPHSGTERDPHLLLAVGSTDSRKGLDRALHFLAGLPEPYHLLHIGGALTPAQVKLVVQLGLESRVEQRGFSSREELSHWYQTAGSVLFPSRYEGFGLPVVEARLCGTLVLASPHVPALEYLRNDPGVIATDFDAFEPIGTAAQRQSAYDTFLARAGKPVELQDRVFFGWKRVVSEYCKLYETVGHQSSLLRAGAQGG